MLKTTILKHCVLTSLVAVLSHTPVLSANTELVKFGLDQRVKARWETLKNHDFGKTYLYQSPNYRAVFPENLYTKQFVKSTNWRLTKIGGIKYTMSGKKATVLVSIETKSSNKSESTPTMATIIEMKEKWLYINDKWWYGVIK